MAGKESYAKRPRRIKKEELCMILSFWMEQSPLLEKPKIDNGDGSESELNGLGAVLVKPSGFIFALDCSRNEAHGVASLLMKFPGHTQDSTIYSSRKPCSFCTKLLVQCRVAKVFYLPIPPERNEKDDIERVDHLFKVSQVAQRVFVPKIDEPVIKEGQEKEPKYSPSDEDIKADQKECIEKWMETYWSKEWVDSQLKENLPWLAYDSQMKKQVNVDMKYMFQWISMAAIIDPAFKVRFKEHKKQSPAISTTKKLSDLGPDIESERWQQLALHITRIAKIISYKTDDPKTGVGSVILMENKEIVAVGWNGFPSKALYGEFPRASDDDAGVDDKKYSYIIHAEQNALLNRNKENINSGSTTLFVSKTPCHECIPLLIQAGVKNVVLPDPPQKGNQTGQLNYDVFETKLNNGAFKGFVSYIHDLNKPTVKDTSTAKRKVNV